MNESTGGTEDKRESKFTKVLGRWDLIVLSFGAMIGWGWVVSSGDWIMSGGVLGAMIGFGIGGLMIFFVGLTYAELTAAIPECGGEHVYSYKALGKYGSFICTWAIILGYVSVVCFEACTVPLVLSYISPAFQQGYLYTVAGFDIYLSCVLTAILTAVLILYLNIRGAQVAARFQSVMTLMILGVGLLFIASSAFSGDVSNVQENMFAEDKGILNSIITVMMITPFFFIGFDVIPQTAEEFKIPMKKVGGILISSIIMAVLFYMTIILAIGLVMSPEQIAASSGGNHLTTADAMAMAFSSKAMSNVMILGGLCGVITSWNSFMMGGSRAIYSMAESYMIPRCFRKLHPRFNTPHLALILIGTASVITPFFGRQMLTWAVDAGNFGCCFAYFVVALSFLILRKKEPDLKRPYRVRHGKAIGVCAMAMSGFMLAMYILPFSGVTLGWHQWSFILGWMLLGLLFAAIAKLRYKEKFGMHTDLRIDDPDGE